MKSLILNLLFAVVTTTALNLPTSGNISNGTLQQQPRLEIFDSTRKLIENLVGNLQKSVKDATETVAKLTTRIQGEAEKFRERITTDVNKLRERVSKAITDVTTRLSNTGSNVVNCVTSHRNEASSLFNDTIAKTINCVEERLSEVTNQITGLSSLANDAIDFGNNALGNMNKCTQGSDQSFISTANCLGTVAVQAEMKAVTFATQSALAIGRATLSVATLPASLEVCVGVRLVDVGISSGKIITDIGSCSANSVLSAFTGGSTGSNLPLLNFNPPSLITYG